MNPGARKRFCILKLPSNDSVRCSFPPLLLVSFDGEVGPCGMSIIFSCKYNLTTIVEELWH